MAGARRTEAWIGLDLGGTNIQGVLLRGEEVADRARRKTPVAGGPADVVEALAAVVDELGGAGAAAGVGVGAPGAVDEAAGVVRRAPNLAPFAGGDIPLGELLAARLGGPPVAVGNDVSTAVHAEWLLGAGRGLHDFLGVWVGTGVGGGLVLDGRLRTGPTGTAGEIGHTVVAFRDGRPCGCGGLGHLEAYAGRAALEQQARDLAASGEKTALVKLAGEGRMTSKVFAKALAADDAVATRLLDEAVGALGAGIATTAALLEVSTAIVGGGLVERLGQPFVARIAEEAADRLFGGLPPVRVVPSEHGDLAGAIGAALLAAGR